MTILKKLALALTVTTLLGSCSVSVHERHNYRGYYGGHHYHRHRKGFDHLHRRRHYNHPFWNHHYFER